MLLDWLFGDASWYYLKGDREYGPYTLAQMRRFVGDGRLLPSDLVRYSQSRTHPADYFSNIIPPSLPPGPTPRSQTPAALPSGLMWGWVGIGTLTPSGRSKANGR